MIPEIGLMIGAYVVTRMVAQFGSTVNPIAQALGVITILVTLFVCAGLFGTGTSAGLPR
jgi:hypothetical protein